MKKILLIAIAAIVACSFNANAQFGKSLKNIGKTVGKAANQVAGELAADAAANQVTNNIVTWMDANNIVAPDDSEYTTRLASIVVPNFITVDGLSLNYKVYLSDEANMLACANGCIRVYSGMMDMLTDTELAAIIATQIGHIINKDARDVLMKVATGNNASNAAAAQLDKMLAMSGDKLGTIVNELIQVPYTYDQNKAADKYAVALLQKNEISPESLVTALEKFAVMETNDEAAANDDELTLSPANKYIKVNSENASRANIVASM